MCKSTSPKSTGTPSSYNNTFALLPATEANLRAVYGYRCMVCGATHNLERHHWLVKRGRASKDHFAELDIVLNVVWLCHNCHANKGQTRSLKAFLQTQVEHHISRVLLEDFCKRFGEYYDFGD